MTEAGALPEVTELRFKPCNPITPWLVLPNVPLAAKPVAELTVPPTAPLVEPAPEPAVLLTAPTVPPTAEVVPPTTPPRPPPPLDRALPPDRAEGAHIPTLSWLMAGAATLAGGASAWTTAPSATSWPSFKTARSKAIPSLDS